MVIMKVQDLKLYGIVSYIPDVVAVVVVKLENTEKILAVIRINYRRLLNQNLSFLSTLFKYFIWLANFKKDDR